MDALKSYSGEEEEESANSSHEEDGQPEEDSVRVASSPKAVTTDQKEREQTNSPPARPLKEEGERERESIKTGQVHRKRKSRSRSRGRSPEHESPSSHRRSHDHHHYRQQYKGRDYRRHRSRSRSRSPAGQRRGSYHKRRSRSRSRSPTHRRRRSRSPDYHHRRRRSSSGDKRGSRKRRSKSPSERGRRTERKGDSSTQSGGGDKGKTDSDLAASQDTKPTGFSAPPTAPPPSQPQQLQEKNGTLVAAPSAVAGAAVGEATAPAMVTAGQGLPTPAMTVPQSAASTVGLLPHPDNANFTPEQRLELAMAVSKAKDLAKGPQLPGFMNPTAMNPVKFQQIKEKRKLLWSGKKAQKQSRNQWESVSFGTDNKETAKFRRLMGISDTACTSSGNKDVQEEHSKRLSVLEHQYESSRFQTHVARGIGLGYGSEALTTELPSQKDTGDKLDEKL